jgi:ring-1,2-phenylacetyl-CoA epoxidase subunit PaaB
MDQNDSTGSRVWEVFVRAKRGMSHTHVGSVHAADAGLALHHARDLFTRRGEGVSVWVVTADAVVASDPNDRAALFESSEDKVFRHATHYEVPEGVEHL